MRLIPGAYEIRLAPPPDPASLDSRYPVTATLSGALPPPHRPATNGAHAVAALSSLFAALALVLALGFIPKALASAIAWLR